MQKRKFEYGLAALAAAWLFDFLFWGKQGGISFLIWTAVLLGLGYLLAWREGKRPSVWSIVLSVLILGFALISAWRSEGLTRFSSTVVALAGLVLLVTTFLNGHWVAYRLVDYLSEIGKTLWAGMSRGFGLFSRPADPHTPPTLPEEGKKRRGLGAVVLGLVIALPILIVLGLMLAAADPIFGDMLGHLFSLQNLPQYIFRFVYIVVGAYVLAGLYLHAVLPLKEAAAPDPQKRPFAPFLGAIEGNIVLGAVNVLFIAFVIVQIRYLFGGSANISQTGYTYADYARRGFGELVGVAVLSLLLYLTFNAITRRESKAAQVGFTALSVLLMANVLVILASSLMRLLMYEDAYGFSELRTYTHVFIFWLAALLVATAVLEVVRRRGTFGLALVLTIVGFTATLGVMNVDGFVTSQNIARISHGYDLDVDYLSTLSTDAVPTMVDAYLASGPAQPLHEALGAELACRTYTLGQAQAIPWQDFRFGQNLADRLLKQNQASWSQYVPKDDPAQGVQVVAGTQTYSCFPYRD